MFYTNVMFLTLCLNVRNSSVILKSYIKAF